MNIDNKKDVVWPVQYAEHPNIWIAWEIWGRGYYDSRERQEFPDKPIGQLVITRDKNFYFEAGCLYDGYKYFWISYESSEWSEMTRDKFKEEMFKYQNNNDYRGVRCYNVNHAYSAIEVPQYYKSDTYNNYREYLGYYYPDYGCEYCSVYVLWNKDNRPIVQIRAKAVGSEVKWDIAYPGDKEYTPLHRRFIGLELETIARRGLARVVQAHPAECFGRPFPPSERLEEPNSNSYQRSDKWRWRYYGEPFPCDTGSRHDSSCLSHSGRWRGYGL